MDAYENYEHPFEDEMWGQARDLLAAAQPKPQGMTKERREEFIDYLGEGFHTALRKVGDSPEASKAHEAIGDMDDDEWGSILDFVADGLLPLFYSPRMDAPAPEGPEDRCGRCRRARREHRPGYSAHRCTFAPDAPAPVHRRRRRAGARLRSAAVTRGKADAALGTGGSPVEPTPYTPTTDVEPTAADMLRAHRRTGVWTCSCGWVSGGTGHGLHWWPTPEQHQADALAAAGLLVTPAHDAEVRADAWDEGHRASGCVYFPDCGDNGHHRNPYRMEVGR